MGYVITHAFVRKPDAHMLLGAALTIQLISQLAFDRIASAFYQGCVGGPVSVASCKLAAKGTEGRPNPAKSCGQYSKPDGRAASEMP